MVAAPSAKLPNTMGMGHVWHWVRREIGINKFRASSNLAPATVFLVTDLCKNNNFINQCIKFYVAVFRIQNFRTLKITC